MRRRTAIAVAMMAVIAAIGASPVGAKGPVVTESHRATPSSSAVRTYGSPGVVVDPANPRNVYAAGVEFRARRCVFHKSRDGGRTWRQSAQSPSPPDFPFCTHNFGVIPVGFLAMGRDNTLYWAFVGSSLEELPNLSILLGRSTDQGETWTTTIVRDTRGKRGPDAERNLLTDLAVDAKSGAEDVVYITWMGGSPRMGQTPPVRRSFVAASTDGGETFSSPVDATESFFSQPANLPIDVTPERLQPGNFGSTQPNMAVDGAGNLHVVWMEFGLGDPFHSPVRFRRMYVSSSADRGRTFSHNLVRTMNVDGVGFLGPTLKWSPKGGPDGSLHLVYESRTEPAQGDRDVQYQRSTDGGRTWSPVRVLNDDDPTQLFGQFLPNVRVAPNGRIDVAWWDTRDGAAKYATDVYYSYSDDGGESWSKNIRVTDRSIDRTIGIWTNNSDTRQPPGLGSADQLAALVWDDTRNGDRVNDVQDLHAAAVQFEALEELPASQKVMAYALAGLAGAGAVGLALLIVALVAHSRRARAVADRGVSPPVSSVQR